MFLSGTARHASSDLSHFYFRIYRIPERRICHIVVKKPVLKNKAILFTLNYNRRSGVPAANHESHAAEQA